MASIREKLKTEQSTLSALAGIFLSSSDSQSAFPFLNKRPL
jgi:hypothetical protein